MTNGGAATQEKPPLTERSRRARAARVIDAPGIRVVTRRLPRWRGVLVLNYHRVGDATGTRWDKRLWNGSGNLFDAQMSVLARDADVVGPDDLAALQRRGRLGRCVMVTFDDGYRSNYEVAYPILRRHGLCATFFVTTGFIDRPSLGWWDEIAYIVKQATAEELPASRWLPQTMPLRTPADRDAAIAALDRAVKVMDGGLNHELLDELAANAGTTRCAEGADDMWMTWEMLREMRAGRMEIGGHTVSHAILGRVPLARQEEEISGSMRRLREELGEARWFSYPVGSREDFTVETKRLLRDHNVELAFSFYGGLALYSRWDRLDIPRMHVSDVYGPELLAATLCIPWRLAL
ncbi:MAG TPA: polysaccharide deacetylase family protein [Conexibacter sp.]